MTTKIFNITGMNCASCVNHIEQNVKKLPGLHHIAVNFAAEKAEIMFDEAHISAKQIMDQIKKTGYSATLTSVVPTSGQHAGHVMPDGTVMTEEDHSEHVKAENAAEIQSKFQKVMVGAVLSIGVLFLSFFIDLR